VDKKADTTPHQVLARKWRPKTLADVVGQSHIIEIIQHSIALNRLHHAYLFSGPHGTGKTSLARVLAKCLNCETGMTETPCLTCESCKAIEKGLFVDLIEIDAASKTKVEDTRDLLDNVQYAPTVGRVKVYLIDEVHMLSGHSFNALLKTLEEPPEHVVFLLATTDPAKLPNTILSRCLKLALKRVSEQKIIDHLTGILKAESVTYESAAIPTIAKAAQGSIRDALSLLDQAIAYSNSNLTESRMLKMLGYAENHQLIVLVNAIIQQDIPALLTVTSELDETGTCFEQVTEWLQTRFYYATLLHTHPNTLADLDELEQVRQLTKALSLEDLQFYYQVLTIGKSDIALAPSAAIGFTMLLFRMITFNPHTQPSVGKPSIEKSLPAQKQECLKTQAKPTTIAITQANWPTIYAELAVSGITKSLVSHASIGNINNDELELLIADEHKPLCSDKQRKLLEEAIEQHCGQKFRVTFAALADKEKTPAAMKQKQAAEAHSVGKQQLQQDANIRHFVEAFDVDESKIVVKTH